MRDELYNDMDVRVPLSSDCTCIDDTQRTRSHRTRPLRSLRTMSPQSIRRKRICGRPLID